MADVTQITSRFLVSNGVLKWPDLIKSNFISRVNSVGQRFLGRGAKNLPHENKQTEITNMGKLGRLVTLRIFSDRRML